MKGWPQEIDTAQTFAQPLLKKTYLWTQAEVESEGTGVRLHYPVKRYFEKSVSKKKIRTESNMNVQFDPWSLCCSSSLSCAAARCARFKLLLCRRDNPSAPRSCTANAQCYSSSSPSSQQDGEQSRRKWTREDKEAGVSWACLYAAKMPLCVCSYNTASHWSSMQDEKSAPTEPLRPRGWFISQDQSQTQITPPPEN